MGCTAWSHRSTDPHWRERNFNLLLTTHTNQNPFELNHLRNYWFPNQWIIFILKYSNLNTKNLWLYFLLILISQVFFDQYTIQLPTASHNHVTTSQFHLLTSATCLVTHVQPHHSQGTKLPISLIYCQLHHCTIIELGMTWQLFPQVCHQPPRQGSPPCDLSVYFPLFTPCHGCTTHPPLGTPHLVLGWGTMSQPAPADVHPGGGELH